LRLHGDERDRAGDKEQPVVADGQRGERRRRDLVAEVRLVLVRDRRSQVALPPLAIAA
jgi:hypothetical protein